MKIGVIGSGSISDIYLTNLTTRFDGLEVVAIASKHLENAREKGEMYGIVACTVEELLAKPEIELVVILTPANTHYQLARSALLASKHVYVEKLMTHQFAKTQELAALAAEKGLYLGGAPDTFLGPAWQTARKVLAERMLGEIQSFSITYHRNNELMMSLFSFLRVPGAGVLHDAGPYYMTALVSLLGPVKRVNGFACGSQPERRGILPGRPGYGEPIKAENENRASAVLQMESGVTGTLLFNGDTVPDEPYAFKIYGTQGVLELSDPNCFGGELKLKRGTVDYRIPSVTDALSNYAPAEEDLRGLGVARMADAIRAGKPSCMTEYPYHVHEVIEAILSGGAAGHPVDILSRAEAFSDSDRARIPVKNIGHISLQMQKDAEMLHFYGEILGMKKQFTMTVGDSLDFYSSQSAQGSAENRDTYEARRNQPWLTYMKLSDHQFVEFFHANGKEYQIPSAPWSRVGYTKTNFEVEAIQDIRQRLVAAGVELAEDVHPTLDGSLELKVYDPDGNEVQFTQYTETAMLPLAADNRESTSAMTHTAQVAFQVKNVFGMLDFYTRGLGLKKAKTLTYRDLYRHLLEAGAGKEILTPVWQKGDRPWIQYIEVGPRQYIELFSGEGKQLAQLPDLAPYRGYQHLCLEVSDIHKAWEVCQANGVTPVSEISLGPDRSYQFWILDPDGNRIELMQYTDQAWQLKDE